MPILKVIGKNIQNKKKKKKTKQTLAGMKRLLNYIARAGKEEQIYKAFGMGLSDNVDRANDKIIFNKKTHDKVDNNLYKHYALSFPPGFDNLELIEKITKEFVQKEYVDKGFIAYVGIHIDKDHFHSHILVDTVNINSGLKLQELNSKDMEKERYKDKILPEHILVLEHLKDSVEEISLKYGVESPERNKEKDKSINIGTMSKYKGITKDNSWRTKIAKTFEEVVLNVTTTSSNLVDRLKEKGIFFNRFNKKKKTLTLGTMYEDKGESKKGLVKLSTLEQEEDYRFQVTKNIYHWDNLWEELDKHKVKILEQEQEKQKEESLSIGDFMDMFKEKSIELEKYIDDKEYQKELKERLKTNEELEREEARKKYVPPITPTPIKSVEKKKEEKKVDEEEKPRLNAVEMAIINQRESERLRELELQKIAEDEKKKKKITYWEDEKDNKDFEKE
jgi:DNA relaxation protein homolog